MRYYTICYRHTFRIVQRESEPQKSDYPKSLFAFECDTEQDARDKGEMVHKREWGKGVTK